MQNMKKFQSLHIKRPQKCMSCSKVQNSARLCKNGIRQHDIFVTDEVL